MLLFSELRARPKAILPTVFGLAALSYFAYHAVSGERGLIAYWQLQSDVQAAEQARDQTRAQRTELEHRVNMLRQQIDPDILEERGRTLLNLRRPNDVVIMIEPGEVTSGDVTEGEGAPAE